MERLADLASRPSRHWYLVVGDLSELSAPPLPVSDYLVAQPISQTRLKTYLKSLPDKPGKQLYRRLQKTGLFDLASHPWLKDR